MSDKKEDRKKVVDAIMNAPKTKEVINATPVPNQNTAPRKTPSTIGVRG